MVSSQESLKLFFFFSFLFKDLAFRERRGARKPGRECWTCLTFARATRRYSLLKLVLLTSTCVGQLVPCRLTISVFPEPGFSCLPHEHTSKRQVHDYIKLSFLKFTFERFDLFMCGLCCVYECKARNGPQEAELFICN